MPLGYNGDMEDSEVSMKQDGAASARNRSRELQVRRLVDSNDAGISSSPQERVSTMWQLVVDSWSFMGKPCDEQRLQRHIVNIQRPKR